MRIAFKELLVFRDFKMLIFMLITPVALMLILGTALTNNFNGSDKIGNIHVIYTNNSNDSSLAAHWEAFAQEAGKSGIRFEKISGNTDGKLEVQNNRYTGYMVMADTGLNYYGNNRSVIESSIVQGMLAVFADRYKLTAELDKADPENVKALLAGSKDYVKETSLHGAKQPGAMDYYAIAVTTLIILYSALTAGQMIETERKRNTAYRLLASPITKTEIFTGKIIGNLLLHTLFIVLIVFISKYMFAANWGGNLGMVFLVLFTEIVFALSLGLGISYVFKGEASGAVIMIIIQLAAFVGGAYFPTADSTGIMKTLSYYSPLRWSNDALLQIIYADNLSPAFIAIMLNIGIAALFLMVAVISMRRREGL
ncbi:ABC transporter permease [Paenibacillus nasutitermitis]|nr:ABC transporter permease [Paenibacillus nasutitermitis]